MDRSRPMTRSSKLKVLTAARSKCEIKHSSGKTTNCKSQKSPLALAPQSPVEASKTHSPIVTTKQSHDPNGILPATPTREADAHSNEISSDSSSDYITPEAKLALQNFGRKLKINQKSAIPMLTKSAKELSQIVSRDRIIDVIIDDTPDDHQCLYLLDSIARTIGGTFVRVISEKIVTIFRVIFKHYVETRTELLELRKTWNGIFPQHILWKIDNAMDMFYLKEKIEEESQLGTGLKNCSDIAANEIKLPRTIVHHDLETVTQSQTIVNDLTQQLIEDSQPTKRQKLDTAKAVLLDNRNDKETCALLVRQVQILHINSEGIQDDIGYNFLIGGDGAAYEGRGWNKIGAHTRGYNSRSIGVAFIGDFRVEEPTNQQLVAMLKLLRDGVKMGKIAENYNLVGTNQVQQTENPGKMLFQILTKYPHWSDQVD